MTQKRDILRLSILPDANMHVEEMEMLAKAFAGAVCDESNEIVVVVTPPSVTISIITIEEGQKLRYTQPGLVEGQEYTRLMDATETKVFVAYDTVKLTPEWPELKEPTNG